MGKRLLVLMLALVLGICAFAVACGGEEATTTTVGGTGTTAAGTETTAGSTTTTAGVTETTVPPSGEPFNIGLNEGFTGFMATDAQLTDQGMQVALKEINNQILGRPVQYFKVDNASDPVVAVDKARQLVQQDKIVCHMGPIYAPAVASVTNYLGREGNVPEIGIMGWSKECLNTASNLSFVPSGFLSSSGYYFGKYCAEVLGYKTVNALFNEDTAGHEIMAGFRKAFEDEAGGKVLYEQYISFDVLDFAPWLTAMPREADACLYWIFGNGATPFISQYHDMGIKMPLVSPMASNLTEEQMKDLGDNCLGIVALDLYTPELDNELNKKFVEDHRAMFGGAYPQMNQFGAWVAVNLFKAAVEKTNGDTAPSALIDAMAGITLDTPAGPYHFEKYQTAWVGVGNMYIMETKAVGNGRYAWVPIKTLEQVSHAPVE
jgi:branched-chain amino acid transport system substrate-binding protein